MLKVKIFTGDATKLEKEINTWLESKSDDRIEVLKMTQSGCTIITILYRDGGS